MKRFLTISLTSISVAVVCLAAVPMPTATAQTTRRRTAAITTEHQIMALRREVVKAIRARNRETLERIYADDFTHTHATGRVDGKAQRISALVSGEPTIESAEADDVDVRTYGAATTVVTGQSTIKGQNEKLTRYRWMAVYVRRANRWQIVASQATRIADE